MVRCADCSRLQKDNVCLWNKATIGEKAQKQDFPCQGFIRKVKRKVNA